MTQGAALRRALGALPALLTLVALPARTGPAREASAERAKAARPLVHPVRVEMKLAPWEATLASMMTLAQAAKPVPLAVNARPA